MGVIACSMIGCPPDLGHLGKQAKPWHGNFSAKTARSGEEGSTR